MSNVEREKRIQNRVQNIKAFLTKKYGGQGSLAGESVAKPLSLNRSTSLGSPRASGVISRSPLPSKADQLPTDTNTSSLRLKFEEKLRDMNIEEKDKSRIREIFLKIEANAIVDDSRRLTKNDFEPLVIIGKGAFGEVRLVRMKGSRSNEIYGTFIFH